MISDEDFSLAWSPMPPFESAGAGDCRNGGGCGIDFNAESRRGKWARARFRYLKEMRRQQVDSILQFDKVHKPCRCVRCAHQRLLRLLADLDAEFVPTAQLEKETVH